MSFSLNFTARSRLHALRLLDLHSGSLPTPVLAFVKLSIENMPPARDAQRIIQVEVSGHLSDSGSSYQNSFTNIKVTPIDIPD